MFLVMKSKKLPHPLVKPMAVFSDKVMESFASDSMNGFVGGAKFIDRSRLCVVSM